MSMSDPAVRRLDRKLGAITAGRYTPGDFVIADAKDADMAFGLTAAGRARTAGSAGTAGSGRYRTRGEFLDDMRALLAQGELDIMLTSAANGERLARDGCWEIRPWPSGETTARTSGTAGAAVTPPCRRGRSARPTCPPSVRSATSCCTP